MIEANKGFRRMKAHKQLSALGAALQAHHDRMTIKPVAHVTRAAQHSLRQRRPDGVQQRSGHLLFHPGDNGFERMAIIGLAEQRLHVGDELTALGVPQRGGDGDLEPELVRPMRLALADAFDLQRMQRIDLGTARGAWGRSREGKVAGWRAIKRPLDVALEGMVMTAACS
jgi:hypothetical protein